MEKARRKIKSVVSIFLAVCIWAAGMLFFAPRLSAADGTSYVIVIRRGICVSALEDDIIAKADSSFGIFKEWKIFKSDNTPAAEGEDYIMQGFTKLSYSQIHLIAKRDLILSADYVTAGDLNGDGAVDDGDALLLLFHAFFPKLYSVNQSCDFTGDNKTDSRDAVYLLFHKYFPSLYPLNAKSASENDGGDIEMPWDFD